MWRKPHRRLPFMVRVGRVTGRVSFFIPLPIQPALRKVWNYPRSHGFIKIITHYLTLVMNVTPSTVRHLNAFPFLMPYCETLRLVRLASPRLVAGIVPTSPTSSVPIG